MRLRSVRDHEEQFGERAITIDRAAVMPAADEPKEIVRVRVPKEKVDLVHDPHHRMRRAVQSGTNGLIQVQIGADPLIPGPFQQFGCADLSGEAVHQRFGHRIGRLQLGTAEHLKVGNRDLELPATQLLQHPGKEGGLAYLAWTMDENRAFAPEDGRPERLVAGARNVERRTLRNGAATGRRRCRERLKQFDPLGGGRFTPGLA